MSLSFLCLEDHIPLGESGLIAYLQSWRRMSKLYLLSNSVWSSIGEKKILTLRISHCFVFPRMMARFLDCTLWYNSQWEYEGKHLCSRMTFSMFFCQFEYAYFWRRVSTNVKDEEKLWKYLTFSLSYYFSLFQEIKPLKSST